MNSKTAVVVGVGIAGVIACLAFPVLSHKRSPQPPQLGPRVEQNIVLKVREDHNDPRVIEIIMTNISPHDIRIGYRVGRLFEEMAFTVSDFEGHVAPLSKAARKTIEESEYQSDIDSTQIINMSPQGSSKFRYDITQIADLSKLNGDKLRVMVAWRPRTGLSGVLTASTIIKRPVAASEKPLENVAPVHIS